LKIFVNICCQHHGKPGEVCLYFRKQTFVCFLVTDHHKVMIVPDLRVTAIL